MNSLPLPTEPKERHTIITVTQNLMKVTKKTEKFYLTKIKNNTKTNQEREINNL